MASSVIRRRKKQQRPLQQDRTGTNFPPEKTWEVLNSGGRGRGNHPPQRGFKTHPSPAPDAPLEIPPSPSYPGVAGSGCEGGGEWEWEGTEREGRGGEGRSGPCGSLLSSSLALSSHAQLEAQEAVRRKTSLLPLRAGPCAKSEGQTCGSPSPSLFRRHKSMYEEGEGSHIGPFPHPSPPVPTPPSPIKSRKLIYPSGRL